MGELPEAGKLLLCPHDFHVDLWYLMPGEGDGTIPSSSSGGSGRFGVSGKVLRPPPGSVPRPQKLMRLSLDAEVEAGGAKRSLTPHLLSSALAPDGQVLALSDKRGTRLFSLNIEELELTNLTKQFPPEVSKESCPTLTVSPH